MSNAKADISILLPILKQIPLFSDLDENSHREIVEQIILMYYPTNYTIFNEGDQGDALYIIKQGLVEILHPPKEEGDFPKKIAEIGPQGFFGEMALVSDQLRNASVRTLTESEIFILKKADFKQLLNNNTVMAEQVSKAMIERLKDNGVF